MVILRKGRGAVFFILFIDFIIMGCNREHIGKTQQGNMVNIKVKVVDKFTKNPIKEAVVYLGSGQVKSYTDENGECTIREIPFGDYSIGVFKRGYQRWEIPVHLKSKNNRLTAQLVKKKIFPETITVKGTVVEKVELKGTRSENHYFKIKTDNGREEFIFNLLGENRRFGEYVGKRVIIKGFRDEGFVGWQHSRVKGIYVENIKTL